MARGLLQAAESTKGCESVEAADAIDLLVDALTRGGKARSEETAELADRAISIREKALGPDDTALYSSLVLKGNLLQDLEKRSEARLLFERALELAVRAYGPDAARVGVLHHNLGNLLRETDVDGAEKHFREALRIFELVRGPDSRDVADVLDGLASCAVGQLRYTEAEELYLRSLLILQQTDGPRASRSAGVHSNLGNLYNETGDYERARVHLLQALSIQEEALGSQHPRLVGTLVNLAIAESQLGISCDTRYERAIALADETLGPDHLTAAVVRANYAVSLSETDFARARRLHEQALAVLTKKLGPLHPRVLWILGGLGAGALRVGDLGTAERYLEQAIVDFEKSPDARPLDLADALQSLAKCRAEVDRIAEARALHERALEVVEEGPGPDHPAVAGSLTRYGDFLRRYGTLGEAESAHLRALQIREKALGEGHPDVAASLFALADVKAEEGKLREARDLFRRAHAIQERARTADDPRNADGYVKYASYLLRSGNSGAALDAALRAESISRRHLRSTIASLSERNALSLVARTPSGLDLAISTASTLREPDSAKAALDTLIRSRALVLDEMGERHQAIRVARDPDAPQLLDDYVAARARLANLTVKGEDDKSPAKYRKRLEEARAAKDAAERALAEKSADFRRSRTQAGAGLAEVTRALPDGAALVAYVRYSRSSTTPASQRQAKVTPPVDSYAAFVLRHGPMAPVLVPLGPANLVDAQVALVRASLAQTAAAPGSLGGAGSFAETAYRRTTAALKDLVWKPLEGYLAGVETAFLVPDGSLALVSFAALPDGATGYLVERGPVVHYLSAERDLVLTALSQGTGLLAAGAPRFDERPSAVQARPASAQERRPATTVASAVFRGALPSCGNFDTLRFAALPSAGLEIEDVADAWRSSARRLRGATTSEAFGAEPVLLSGPGASEAAVKAIAPGRRIVHLATHGFFLGDCPSASGSEAARPTRSATVFADNPLLLSGLALAGANQRSTAPPGAEDGILTAEEIAALDLSGVEWAVLSACETGVGELRSGEGLFGLRRAFQIAGARSLILSLWPVEDEASRQWMKTLYRNRLVRGMTTAKAVHEASREELLKRRAAGQSTHPFYWAGFVAAGDWR